VWTPEDIKEVNINARALSAARNLLFARIKDPEKRPFKTPVAVDDFVEMSYAKKAIDDLEAEKKAVAEKPPGNGNPPAPGPKSATGETPKEKTPAMKDEKPQPPPSATPPKQN
jgi:hypothetical protein